MEKAFSQGHEETVPLSSICSNQAGLQGGEKIVLQFSSSTPLTPYLSNLTKARKTEGNKRQSYGGNLKLLKQNGKHMK